jgi:hypothetical protein
VKTFEVHPEHPWEKRQGFTFWCIGIPPEAEQPPCQAMEGGSICGQPAPVEIRIRTSIFDGKMDVCVYHKKRHDSGAAALRTSREMPKAS